MKRTKREDGSSFRLIIVALFLSLIIVAPAAASEDGPFVYVHFSDTHVGTAEDYENDKDERYRKLCQALEEVNSHISPALAIVTGDLTSKNDEISYEKYRDWVALADFPVHSLPGNHDRSRGERNYERELGKSSFSSAYGPYYFVGFDSWNLLGDRSPQVLFSSLEMQLAKGRRSGLWLIAAAHYPLFIPDQVVYGQDRDHFQITGERAHRLMGLFLKYEVDVYHCGHTHSTYDVVDPVTGTIHMMGPTGYHYGQYRVVVIDGGDIGWSVNKPDEWPLVVVTAPARHITGSSAKHDSVTAVRAVVFPREGISGVRFQVDEGESKEMATETDGLYRAEFDAGTLKRGVHLLTVTARDEAGRERSEEIRFLSR